MNAIFNILDYVAMSFIIYNILILTNYPKPKVAWLPVYRYYVVLKEYQFRIYKRDYSKIFLALIIINVVLSVYLAVLTTQDARILEAAALGDSSYVYKIIILAVVMIIIGIVIELMIVLPLFKTKMQKIAILLVYLGYVVGYCYFMKDMFGYFSNMIQDSLVQGEILEKFKVPMPDYYESGYSIAITLIVLVIYLLQMSKLERGEIEIKPWISKENFKQSKILDLYLFKNKN